ncbi:MAG: polysaccharide lyase family 8 super-sandwich domain-containing protein [Microbacterium sp.]
MVKISSCSAASARDGSCRSLRKSRRDVRGHRSCGDAPGRPRGHRARGAQGVVTLPDAYVALGSDIATKSAGEVRTVVEHRNLGENAQRLVVDGTEVTGESVIASARWAHLDGVGGYVFLDGSADLRAGVAMREGTWRRNSTNAATGTDVVRRRTYGSLSLSHGTGADAGGGYAYIVHPGADAAATAAASASPRVRVLRNDAVAQAIRHSGHVTAAAFWSAGAAGGIAVDRA